MTWTWTSNEAATFECSADAGATFKPCTSPYTAPGIDRMGDRPLIVRATDAAGNVTVWTRYGFHSGQPKTTTTTKTTTTAGGPGTGTTTSRTPTLDRGLLDLRLTVRTIDRASSPRPGCGSSARAARAAGSSSSCAPARSSSAGRPRGAAGRSG